MFSITVLKLFCYLSIDICQCLYFSMHLILNTVLFAGMQTVIC